MLALIFLVHRVEKTRRGRLTLDRNQFIHHCSKLPVAKLSDLSVTENFITC